MGTTFNAAAGKLITAYGLLLMGELEGERKLSFLNPPPPQKRFSLQEIDCARGKF